MPKLQLSDRIYLCLLPLLTLFLLLFGYSILSVYRMNLMLEKEVLEVKEVHQNTLDYLELLGHAQEVIVELAFLPEDPEVERLEFTYDRFLEIGADLSLPSSPALQEFTEKFRTAIDNYQLDFINTIDHLKTNPEDFITPIRNLHRQTRELVRELSDYYSALDRQNIDSLNMVVSVGKKSAYLLGVGILLAILVTLLATRQLTKLIVEPVRSLRQRMEQVDKAHLPQVPYPQETLELYHLEKSFSRMIEQIEQYRLLTDQRIIALTSTFRMVMEEFPSPVFLMNSKGKVIYRNTSAHELAGIGQSEELPDEIKEFIRKKTADGEKLLLQDPDEAIPIRINENVNYFLLNHFPINLDGFTDNEDVDRKDETGSAYVLQDVTLSRLSNDLKSNLLETVSHELKTPITSARLALYLLLDSNLGTLTDKHQDLVNMAKQDLDRLLATIQNLLDLTRIRNHSTAPEMAPMNLNSIVRQSTVKYAEMASTQNVKINLGEKTQNSQVNGDEKRLSVVLNNFLSNALRHSEAGSVIDVNIDERNENTRVEVIDYGKGMPEHIQNLVFDKFSRPSEIISAGGGISLHIAKEIVEEHDGQIGCHCKVDEGCTFYFELPKLKQTADQSDINC